MTYRDDLVALEARHEALAAEVAGKTRELEHATRLLDEARERARLPVLDNIRVASPCSAAWADMSGDDRVRHCGACDKQVYNLSGMTRDEAEALIRDKQGRLCVRYFQRKDGTILTADCTIGVKRRRRLKLVAAGAAALIAGGAYLAIRDAERERLGAMAPEPAPVEMLGGAEVVVPEPPPVEAVGVVAEPPEPEHLEEVKGEIAPERW